MASSLTVSGTFPLLVKRTKCLGLVLDNSLSFLPQIQQVVKTCMFHLRTIKKIKPFLSDRDCATVLNALVTSRLDYGNALYVGLPRCGTRLLQGIQNASAQIPQYVGLPEHCEMVVNKEDCTYEVINKKDPSDKCIPTGAIL
ncbi:hypothetical protein EOD39_2087 [Acipenser ruthenus]|uniref:Uncharacterized protein n=1 Tax=Acipenser ruthenus TaxID=7906 RepID=A0A662Z2T2_ACIRT|nr:hypothetical protein EOD39_2087 [Acipenser ruthenus]